MTTYAAQISNKKFQNNIVISIIGQYFCMNLPDSGLDVEAKYCGIIDSVSVSPTALDLKYVNTAITSYNFDLNDKDGVITALTQGLASIFMGIEVQVYVGRSGVGMDFADYFALPVTRVKTMSYVNGVYSFTTVEQTDRMNKPFFNVQDKMSADISDSDTSLTTNVDTSSFPATGIIKVDDEFISYGAKDDPTKTFSSLTRARKGSTAAAHKAGADVYNVTDISGNPLTLLMQVLISVGGGGTYDALSDGLALSHLLIDTDAIENIRDLLFPAEVFSFSMYGIKNALKWIENELLLSCNLRFVISSDSKISVALLDQSVFGVSVDSITEDSITAAPVWTVDENDVINVINIAWDWNEGTQTFQRTTQFTDANSIVNFSKRAPLNLAFQGIKAATGGSAMVTSRGNRLISRFATPTPTIEFTTHMDKSLINMGDKALVTSGKIPSENGTLQFSKELEVLSRSFDILAASVSFKMAYTNYVGFRQGYIAPSDRIISFTSQRSFTVASGRGAQYTVGWVMRLWDHGSPGGVVGDYTSDAINVIESISGDVITMTDDWSTTLIANQMRLKFCDYDDASIDQKRYAFISAGGADFADGSATYEITF